MQNGFRKDGDTVRLAISKALKRYMLEAYAIDADYIFLRSQCSSVIARIKQIKLYDALRQQKRCHGRTPCGLPPWMRDYSIAE